MLLPVVPELLELPGPVVLPALVPATEPALEAAGEPVEVSFVGVLEHAARDSEASSAMRAKQDAVRRMTVFLKSSRGDSGAAP